MIKYAFYRTKHITPFTMQSSYQSIANIKLYLSKFKKINRQIKAIDDGGNVAEEMGIQFDRVKDDLKDLRNQQNTMFEMLQKICQSFESNSDSRKISENELSTTPSATKTIPFKIKEETKLQTLHSEIIHHHPPMLNVESDKIFQKIRLQRLKSNKFHRSKIIEDDIINEKQLFEYTS